MNSIVSKCPHHKLGKFGSFKTRSFGLLTLIILFFELLFFIFKFLNDRSNKSNSNPRESFREPCINLTSWDTRTKTKAFIEMKNLELLGTKATIKPNVIELDIYVTTPLQHRYKADLMQKLLAKRNIKRYNSARKRLDFKNIDEEKLQALTFQ